MNQESNPQRIRVTMRDDGVADVRLARADKMNALDGAMFDALLRTGERLMHQPGLRAVVLSGEGRAFCAGLDMASFGRMAGPAGGSDVVGRPLTERSQGLANAAQQAALVWRELPVPVIAALHGVAFGGGLQIALGADLRYVAADLRLSVMEIKWGLVPDMAGVLLMRELVRADLLRELVFSGRVFSGSEAVALGIATRVCADPLAEALAFATEVAAKSPDAIRAAKRLLNLSASSGAAEILLAESAEQQALIGSANQTEAVRANLEKRAATFCDPAP